MVFASPKFHLLLMTSMFGQYKYFYFFFLLGVKVSKALVEVRVMGCLYAVTEGEGVPLIAPPVLLSDKPLPLLALKEALADAPVAFKDLFAVPIDALALFTALFIDALAVPIAFLLLGFTTFETLAAFGVAFIIPEALVFANFGFV
jgi:hypothetical protein